MSSLPLVAGRLDIPVHDGIHGTVQPWTTFELTLIISACLVPDLGDYTKHTGRADVFRGPKLLRCMVEQWYVVPDGYDTTC